MLLCALQYVPGASDSMHQQFAVEVRHVLRSPAVRGAMRQLGQRYQMAAGVAARAIHLATCRQEGPAGLVQQQAAGAGAGASGVGSKRARSSVGAVLVQLTEALVDGILACVADAEDVSGAKLLRYRVADHCREANSDGVLAHRGMAMKVLS